MKVDKIVNEKPNPPKQNESMIDSVEAELENAKIELEVLQTKLQEAEKRKRKRVDGKEVQQPHKRVKNGESRPKPKMKKTEIGNLVVKLLTPAYSERRFDSRETFKKTARTISHLLLYKGKSSIVAFFEFFYANLQLVPERPHEEV